MPRMCRFTGCTDAARTGFVTMKEVTVLLLTVLWIGSASGKAYAQANQAAGIGLLEAVRSTISKQPNILLQEQQTEIARGEAQIATGQFDYLFGTSLGYDHRDTPFFVPQNPGYEVDGRATDTTFGKIDLKRQFRSGITVGPELELTHTDPEIEQIDGPDNTQGSFNFIITIPLLKGFGVEATGAQEIAAQKGFEASILDLQHTTARNVLDTVSAYWNYLAAKQRLGILTEAENRAKRLVMSTQTLIQEDEVPAAEIETALANQANKTGNRIGAEQALVEAKDALGLAMGLSYEEIDALSQPADAFPKLDYERISAGRAYIQYYRQQALANRADYLALKKKEEATQVLLVAAKNNLLSRLDLKLNAGYTGLTDGSDYSDYYLPLYRNVPGANAGLLLRYEWPFKNNSAKGVLLQKASIHRQAVITTQNNIRTTLAGVARSVSALKNSAEGLLRFRRAVSSYRTAVENEKKKALMGIATLLDLVNTEDRLTNAIISEISAKLTYANAVASLRYETGTLLRVDQNDVIGVDANDLVSIPTPQEAGKVRKQIE